MRAWPALLLLVPLSGCMQGDTGGSSTSAFVATCPNWTLAEHPLAGLVDTTLYQAKQTGQRERTNSEVFPYGKPPQAPPDENGKRADRYLLKFPATTGEPIVVENGTLTIKAYRNDTNEQLPITDTVKGGSAQMEVKFPSGAKPFVGSALLQVDLVPATKEPSPAPLRLETTFKANDGFFIGPGTSGTPRVGASFSVSPTVMYRAAGCLAK